MELVERLLPLARPGRYTVQEPVGFSGLRLAPRKGSIGIRLSAGRATELEIPLTESGLLGLVQALRPLLEADCPQRLREELEILQRQAGRTPETWDRACS